MPSKGRSATSVPSGTEATLEFVLRLAAWTIGPHQFVISLQRSQQFINRRSSFANCPLNRDALMADHCSVRCCRSSLTVADELESAGRAVHIAPARENGHV